MLGLFAIDRNSCTAMACSYHEEDFGAKNRQFWRSLPAMATVDEARIAAKLLAKRFMISGSYALAAGPIGVQQSGVQLAAALQSSSIWTESVEFTGVAVQAVGYTLGVDNPAVIVYATKGSAKAFSALPSEIDSVPVIVKRIGVVDIRPDLASATAGNPHVFIRNNRIACGSSCAPAVEQYAGTFGALVDKSGQMYALSNNHVLAACNHTPVNMPIMSPATIDARPNIRAPRAIARHSEIVPLRSGDPDLVDPCAEDIAIAEVPDQDAVCSWQGGEDGFDTPATITPPTSGMPVKKVGRTTGLTTGTIEALISEPTPIPCQTRFFRGTVWFREMWYVLGDGPGFALPGDSGSLVVSQDGQNAVGMLFSSNKTGDYGLMIPIDHILGLFNGMSLISAHGV